MNLFLIIIALNVLNACGVSSPEQTPCARENRCECEPITGADIRCDAGVTDLSLRRALSGGKGVLKIDTFWLSNNNNIKTLSDDMFANVLVKDFNIRKVRRLTTVEEGTFAAQANITQTLKIVSCSLNDSVALFKAVSQLTVLSVLVLSDNQLEDIPAHAFADTQTRLKMIIIAGNRIKHMGADGFHALYSLNYLDLSRNALTTLGDRALAIRNDTRDRYVHSIAIDLSGNQLTDITVTAFEPLYRVVKLDLSFNKLTKLTPESLKNILRYDSSSVRVKGNQLKCVCDLKWIYDNQALKTRFSGPLRCADKRYFQELTDNDFKDCPNVF